MKRLIVAALAALSIAVAVPTESAHAWTPTGACAEWWPAARRAGFTPAQWPTVNYIMYRESRCYPRAYNPSGARGLMQIMPFWAAPCGREYGVVGYPDRLFRPWFNMHCARYILRVQGWDAWSTY